MVVRQDIDNTSAIVTVTLTRDEYKPKLDAELKRYRQKAPIKGFRPGQAPMDFVKRMFGNAIFGELMQDTFAEQLVAHLRETRLDVLGQPLPVEDQPGLSFNVHQLQDEYTVQYEVGFVPKFDLKGLDKSDAYERMIVSDLDSLAEEDLQQMRKRAAKRTSPEDDIRENDMVRIAAHEMEGDQPKEGGLEAKITVLMSNIADEQLKAQLLSLKKGDALRFNPRHIETFEQEEKYRKYILNLEDDDDRAVGDTFEGTIEEVSRVEEGELDEAFFQENFDTDNREEAMEMLKTGIAKYYEPRSNALLMRQFQDRLMELNPIELPEKFLKRWLRISDQNGRLSDEDIDTEYPAFAENLRWTVIRDDIKAEFGIQVTDREIRAAFVNRIKGYFQSNNMGELPDTVFESAAERMMKDEKEADQIRREVEMDKIFQTIRDQVTVNDVSTPSADLHKALEGMQKRAEHEETALQAAELPAAAEEEE
jgi:trigger factor